MSGTIMKAGKLTRLLPYTHDTPNTLVSMQPNVLVAVAGFEPTTFGL